MEADYIVVGTGSAGSVLANRLSTVPGVRVAVIEAGPRDKDKFIHVPAAFSKLFRSPVDWNYLTEPQKELDGRAGSPRITTSGASGPVRTGPSPASRSTSSGSRTGRSSCRGSAAHAVRPPPGSPPSRSRAIGEGVESAVAGGVLADAGHAAQGSAVEHRRRLPEAGAASADPRFKPLIDPRYLSDDAGEDRAALMEGLRITARIAESPGMRDVLGGIARPAGARELIGEKASDLIRSSSS